MRNNTRKSIYQMLEDETLKGQNFHVGNGILNIIILNTHIYVLMWGF